MKKRKAILIVDDEEISRELLTQIFESQYDIIQAQDGGGAIRTLEQNINDIAVVLLALVMSEPNSLQVLQVLNAKRIVERTPVVLITPSKDMKVELSGYALGALAVISKPYVAQAVRMQVNNIIEMYKRANEMEDTIQGYQMELLAQQSKMNVFYNNLLDAVSNIVEFRDVGTGEHVKRVKGFTRIMAQAVMELYPEKGLTDKQVDTIVQASALHDIGKIAIPDNILLKPGRLTDEERRMMKNHTLKGCEILNLIVDLQDEELFKTCYDICRSHHERYDGGGYPDGIAGDEIPLSAQIVSVVDVYDALVGERVYKKVYDKETAYNMIMNGECGMFSPEMLKCFEFSKSALEAFSDSH
ncbi:MAG: HD domain-containing protein [Butyrivibrio sp.]|nr:HD domain-containing protein [Muribaculum sp.]MCM1551678.1 HD domain-containing protein [Butyrivibrio sp.]